MKKIGVILLFCFLLSISVLHAEFMNPDGSERTAITDINVGKLVPITQVDHRENTPVPDYSFYTNPTTIMTSYYDYMPGSYEGYPLQKQTDNGDGLYITWFGTATTTATRRQYYAYADAFGSIGGNWGTISTYDRTQGYGSVAVHPATGDCFATWHENPSGSNYGCVICYDDYSLLSIPGFWSSVTFIPSPLPDEYIWPYVYVGPSPNGDGWIRLYHISKNYTHDAWDHPCEDPRIMYIDVENTLFADMTVILNLNNWTTVNPMYYWRAKSCRPQSQAFAIDHSTPGHVAIVGYCSWLEGDLGDMPVDPGFYIFESFDYGTTWDTANLHGDGPQDFIYAVENIPHFTDNSGNLIDSIKVDSYGWHDTAQFDANGVAHLCYLQQYGYTDDAGDSYYFNHFLPQAEAVWDGIAWDWHNVPAFPGIDPWTGRDVPWEIVGNDTLLYVSVSYNKYPEDSEIFHQNTQRNAINKENNWMVQFWTDGTYVQLAEDGDPAYAAYAQHPILYLSVSSNNGDTWSEPIELSDIYSTQFDFSGQITVYQNLYNYIEAINDSVGRVHIMYYDDNSFGCYIRSGAGQDVGGQITYCSVDIVFPPFSNDPQPSVPVTSLSNYPNPFFASTTINFTAKKAYQNAEISVYNTRGQLINTLHVNHGDNPSEGYAVWNGKDAAGKNVANGIYFYKVDVDGSSLTQKMMLTR
ncbi:MAG: T9SS type A sorting domain-containing protein [Candidatus Cloacimonetes bacterium]|nr:T9SS type A sorting domain-containing protein [Candidatus Cloacimonadota bacterium]